MHVFPFTLHTKMHSFPPTLPLSLPPSSLSLPPSSLLSLSLTRTLPPSLDGNNLFSALKAAFDYFSNDDISGSRSRGDILLFVMAY